MSTNKVLYTDKWKRMHVTQSSMELLRVVCVCVLQMLSTHKLNYYHVSRGPMADNRIFAGSDAP